MSSLSEMLEQPDGAHWLKADLHIHTPASKDIADSWKTAAPEDLLRIAEEKSLDVIAITDHNTDEWCERMLAASANSTVTIFPGVEISTPQGHLLAIFDPSMSPGTIGDLLVRLGIERKNFGSLDVVTEKSLLESCGEITRSGGVAIAAHIDGSKGLLKSTATGADRKRTYESSDLWAVELLDAGERARHQSGEVYGRMMTCIQSSDSWLPGGVRHDLDGVGNRYTLLKMGDRSILGLKLALIDPEIRVRLAGDEAPSVDQMIEGMWISGGFLEGQIARFNENINCFIGDTGSGKSLAVELLRFGLDQQTGVRKLKQEIDSLLRHQLGELGSVHIVVRKGGIRYQIERVWSESAAAPTVRRISESGLEPMAGIDVPSFFPIKAFSQSEIIEFAREPKVRLSLTDDLIDKTAETISINGAKVELDKNAAQVLGVEAEIANVRELLKARSGLEEELQQIDAVVTDGRVLAQELWYEERRLMDDARRAVVSAGAADTLLQGDVLRDVTWPDEDERLPNANLLRETKQALDAAKDQLAELEVSARAGLAEALGLAESKIQEWHERFARAEEEYQERLDELGQAGSQVQVLADRRKELREKRAKLDGDKRKLETDFIPKHQRLVEERDGWLTTLQDSRRKLTRKRKDKVDTLNSVVDHSVRLRVHERAERSEFRRRLEKIAEGSYVNLTDLSKLANNGHPIPLVSAILSMDLQAISEASHVDIEKIDKIASVIRDRDRLKDLYSLQLVEVNDVVDVQLKVEGGEYRSLEELSHGQKCMVILMVALAEGGSPLVVDQPEDALHAPGIEKGIVGTLRNERGGRQCVFATLNGNILVSADAEQIIALDSSASNGWIASTGCLDRFDHRELVVYHVEGGEKAFERRQAIYTLEVVV